MIKTENCKLILRGRRFLRTVPKLTEVTTGVQQITVPHLSLNELDGKLCVLAKEYRKRHDAASVREQCLEGSLDKEVASVATRLLLPSFLEEQKSELARRIHGDLEQLKLQNSKPKSAKESSAQLVELQSEFPLRRLHRVTYLAHSDSDQLLQRHERSDEDDQSLGPISEKQRGFLVHRGTHIDHYRQSTLDAIPYSEVYEFNPKSTSMQRLYPKDRSDSVYGCTEPHELIDFELPFQEVRKAETVLSSRRRDDWYSDDWRMRYGSEDPSIPAADASCPACGAKFQCKVASLPGFLPVEVFGDALKLKFKDVLCRRCYLLKHHNFLLNVSVSRVDYANIMSRLRHIENVLILLVVDLLDFPCSIYKQLPAIIGSGKPVIVVGNKLDLLPPDSKSGYLKRFRSLLKDAVAKLGLTDRLDLMDVSLISARSGLGVEDLITLIHTKWCFPKGGDIYLVGCTNVGKSTLFNTFLQSDMCKIRACDLVERATTSVWPGTTLNLLRFPVFKPSTYRLRMRVYRLKSERVQPLELRHQNLVKDKELYEPLLNLQSFVGKSFKFEDDEEDNIHTDVGSKKTETKDSRYKLPKQWNPFSREFIKGPWCFDTPGVVNKDQLIHHLTLDELVAVLPRSVLVPRTYYLSPGNSLFLSGLCRLDCITGPHKVLCTVFANHSLPVHCVKTVFADDFWEENVGTDVMKVPIGGPTRLAKLPALDGKEFRFLGNGPHESAVDIVMSSVGWIALAFQKEIPTLVKAYTPGGIGIYTRTPSLLPGVVNIRGKKLKGSSAYGITPLMFPGILGDFNPFRRQVRERNRHPRDWFGAWQ